MGLCRPDPRAVEAVHFTYKEHIRCIADAETGAEIELGFHDDMLVHDGKAMPARNIPATVTSRYVVATIRSERSGRKGYAASVSR